MSRSQLRTQVEDYWNRPNSLQRRRERYRIIYAWKILEGIVPNLSSDENVVRSVTTLRYGRRYIVPPLSRATSQRVRSVREGSFSVQAANLFNVLPCRSGIRQMLPFLSSSRSSMSPSPTNHSARATQTFDELSRWHPRYQHSDSYVASTVCFNGVPQNNVGY